MGDRTYFVIFIRSSELRFARWSEIDFERLYGLSHRSGSLFLE